MFVSDYAANFDRVDIDTLKALVDMAYEISDIMRKLRTAQNKYNPVNTPSAVVVKAAITKDLQTLQFVKDRLMVAYDCLADYTGFDCNEVFNRITKEENRFAELEAALKRLNYKNTDKLMDTVLAIVYQITRFLDYEVRSVIRGINALMLLHRSKGVAVVIHKEEDAEAVLKTEDCNYEVFYLDTTDNPIRTIEDEDAFWSREFKQDILDGLKDRCVAVETPLGVMFVKTGEPYNNKNCFNVTYLHKNRDGLIQIMVYDVIPDEERNVTYERLADYNSNFLSEYGFDMDYCLVEILKALKNEENRLVKKGWE